jgi:superfamily I DNA and/or RNA helicase/predicted DNA-binding WGR domain protein
MSPVTTFQQYLQSAFRTGPWSTDEVIEFVLPLFEEVLSFHEANQVGSFENADTVFLTNGRLDIDENFTHEPLLNLGAVQTVLDQMQINGYSISERLLIDEDVTNSKASLTNLHVQSDPSAQLTHPVYFPGYKCYEITLGHHDAQTDIFCLGLILGSVVMGLNLYDLEDLNQFVAYRNQPAGINPRVHPTVCALVSEMTSLDRKERSRDLHEILQRLKFYRDYDPQLQADLSELAAFNVKKPSDRKTFILSKLRNRLFDTSRRNRLLYYKPNSRFVNLTVSSVPMVLHYQSINPQHLFTWNSEMSSQIIAQKDIPLNKYLRFEDHPYLNAQLNGIRQHSENDKKEYGFSQLKLVIAFLHWHNLKEDAKERIQSPLLLLPVELERKKSLKEERFTLKIIDNAAVVNPVLANHLKELYGIILPETVDFDDVSMEQFFELLQGQIASAKQGVKLNYVDKPRLKIVYNVARQTVNNYRKKLKLKGSPAFQQIDYSYSEENYKPLGLELFRQKVQVKQSALEFLVSDTLPPAYSENFAEASETIKGTFHLSDGESNPYSWDFDVCNIVLGNFNYKKMSLVSDYNKVADERIDHPVFNELFSNEPKKVYDSVHVGDLAEWYHVITADPTQAKAVTQSRSGRSYIIQGPPGTGKSQTITNLIADFLANGKTILFVCEKRAALDVVYHRLQQNQLSELCCYIHDSQGDKKGFFKDLKTVYDDFLKTRMDLAGIRAQRKVVLDEITNKIGVLQVYHEQQSSVNEGAGVSTRRLVETLIQLRQEVPNLDNSQLEQIPTYKSWLQFGAIITQLGKMLEETGAEPEFASHSFSNLGVAVLKAENPFTLMGSLVKHADTSIQHITDIVSKHNIPAQYTAQLEKLRNLVEDAVVLESLAHSRNLKLVNETNPEAKEFEGAYREYKQVQESYQQMLDLNKNWSNKLSKSEVAQALELAQRHENSFFSFLNGRWRQLKKQLKQSYDFSSHQLKPGFSLVIKQLQEEYKAQDRAAEKKSILRDKYNTEDVASVYAGIELLRRKQGDQEIDFLLQHAMSNDLVLQLSKLNNTLHQFELSLQEFLFEYEGKSLSQIRDEVATIASNAGLLKELLPALRRFADFPESLQILLRKLPLSPVQLEAAMANKTLQLLLGKNIPFSRITHKVLEENVKGVEDCYAKLLKLNGEYIRAEKRQNFLERYDLSNTSASVLTSEQKQLKKQYTEGRKILEREMTKTMRYKSIRDIASNESGLVLRDIKPVWLMSPLSVSDSLPLDVNFFDVVIFDEASQITLEEGIPALFRAPQAIIVGDDKQMPPSNFFNSKSGDPEDLETIEGEKEDEILSVDADSLLVQGARKLDSTMLSWHYRSRYETLISYSNHAFYDAGLLTIPDKTIHHNQKPLLEVQQPDEGLANAALLLTGSISFHYLPNSIYEARSNVSEAKYIACLVKQLLLQNIEETIGIVAFSQEQQGIIEEAIEELSIADKEFEAALEKAYNRKDDGQFTGLFVKNLENVQGDERDIIIMSVCYGHDSNKKMLMNFGPINRKGGEKRLNVIFSRAKKHMAIVSSIRHHNITNDYNDGANYFKRFLQYAEMVSTGNMNVARSILDGLITSEHKKKDIPEYLTITTKQIKSALEAKGYTVEEKVGQSSFKCTLAVKKDSTDMDYSLGIIIDDESHYSNDNLVEQYYQRPSILKDFGWQISNVYAKDWLEDSNEILNLLVSKLEDKKHVQKDPQPLSHPVQERPSGEGSTMLHSSDGQKFWEISLAKAEIHIRFGKVGSLGQVQVKRFGSEIEAVAAKDHHLASQIQNGYVEV